MKSKLIYLLAGALALGVTTYSQAEEKDGRPAGRPQRGDFSPEQREKMLKDIGLNADDLKGLEGRERFAKIREASEKKLTELQKKKADGTISDSEKETLERLEQRKKAFQGGNFRGGGDHEQMDKFAKELGLNPDELKNLSQDERREKIREAAKAKYAELQKKEKDGTITDAEKETLKRMEERHKQIEERGGDRPHRSEKPADKK